jgi:hypothetical protein
MCRFLISDVLTLLTLIMSYWPCLAQLLLVEKAAYLISW